MSQCHNRTVGTDKDTFPAVLWTYRHTSISETRMKALTPQSALSAVRSDLETLYLPVNHMDPSGTICM